MQTGLLGRFSGLHRPFISIYRLHSVSFQLFPFIFITQESGKCKLALEIKLAYRQV